MKTLLVWTLRGYRKFISPIYGDVCRYYPTCSAYALEAVTVHGAVKGSYLSLRRLIRCHPWSAGGFDHVPPRTREEKNARLLWKHRIGHHVAAVSPGIGDRSAVAPVVLVVHEPGLGVDVGPVDHRIDGDDSRDDDSAVRQADQIEPQYAAAATEDSGAS